ncbi:MAG: hypothetical protein ACLQMS_12295, partial [Desulfomonilaceae bacterium]
MKARRLIGLFIAIIFVLTTVVVFAAGDSYVVIKDKNGVCKVIEAKEKTPATIAGPFKTKEEAEKGLAKACPKSTMEKIKEKAAEGMEKAKTEAEKLKEKAGPGIEKAKDAAEKLKEKAEEGIDKAKE